MRFLLVLLTLTALALPSCSSAQKTPARAIALPLKKIVIDGKLDDWPRNLEKHSILNHGQAYGPTDIDTADLKTSPDLSPSFMVGYNPAENVLYLAVSVRDDTLSAGKSRYSGGQAIFATDGCEIYVEGTRRRRVSSERGTYPERTGVMQYILCPPGGSYDFSDADASTFPNPSLSGGEIKSTKTRGAFSRKGDISTFEWAIEAYDRYPGTPTRLIPGRTIGIDVVINDYDGSGVSAWVSWSEFKPLKFANGEPLGEILIVDDPQKLGTAAGTITNSRTSQPFGNFGFEVYRGADLMGSFLTDDQGRFTLPLLAGTYDIKPKPRQGVDIGTAGTVTVKPAAKTAVNITPRPTKVPSIVEKSVATYKSFSSYRDSTIITTRMDDENGLREEIMPHVLVLQRPGKVRIDFQIGVEKEQYAFSFYSWGDSMAVYDSIRKRYMRHRRERAESDHNIIQGIMMEQASQIGGNLLDMLFILDSDPLELILKNVDSIREAGRDTVDGEPATKVEFVKSYDTISRDLQRRAPDGLDMLTVTLWFGNNDFLIKKTAFIPSSEVLARNMPLRPGQPAPGGKIDVTVRHKNVEVNPRLSADDIQFRPPEDAEEKSFELARRQPQAELKARKLDGKPAPEFTLKDTGDKEVKLTDYRGKVVLLEFWASWNDACLETMKTVQRVHVQFQGRGFEALGINTLDGEDAETITSFLEKNGITHPVLLDTENTMGEKYGFTKIPVCFLVDKKGVVRVTYESAPNEDILKKVIEKLLQE